MAGLLLYSNVSYYHLYTYKAKFPKFIMVSKEEILKKRLCLEIPNLDPDDYCKVIEIIKEEIKW